MWQISQAEELMERSRSLQVGADVAENQLHVLNERWCGTRDSSLSSNLQGTVDIIFTCHMFLFNANGFRASRRLEVEFILSNNKLMEKSAVLFYDGERAIGIQQTMRGFGYLGEPGRNVENRFVMSSRSPDGKYKNFILKEDSTLGPEQRERDWQLQLACLWSHKECKDPARVPPNEMWSVGK